ncbi:MAG: hypothetical protein HY586_00920 [Candidatus Omnitrophica bacterium]|nr:hypothetical protein [Candidatus Omnitrophota bacterium]
MFKTLIFLHHIGIEIMGKEYEPEGVVQHVCLIVISSIFLFFTVYGFIAFMKKLFGKAKAVNPAMQPGNQKTGQTS